MPLGSTLVEGRGVERKHMVLPAVSSISPTPEPKLLQNGASANAEGGLAEGSGDGTGGRKPV